MGVAIASRLQDVADNIDRLTDEILHEDHDAEKLDRLGVFVEVLSQSLMSWQQQRSSTPRRP